MTGRYFEDFNVGDKIITPGKTITDTAITTIVGLAGFTDGFFQDEEYLRGKAPSFLICHLDPVSRP